ncbi:MAG: cytidylate kinase-like family protein [Lachnospiraceae bacterium]|nr:cytidylate kinase-like family protein [Lachnospiraceae bacterium]
MAKKVIITIGRQYGSGGAEVGKKLGAKLGLDVYDKEILKMTSNESGIRESYFHIADERAGKKLLYKIIQTMVPENTSPSLGSDLVSSDNLFRFQSSVIRKLAQEQSCVIIGRCAEHVLAGEENLVRVFIRADMNARIERIREKGYYAEEDIPKNIKRMDKERRDYHRYFTGKDWESIENYDLILDSSKIGTDGCVECITNYLKVRGLLDE